MVTNLSDEMEDEAGLFRQLLESLDYVFWVRDVPEDRIIYVSPAFEKLWGLSSEDLYQDPLAFIGKIHPDDRNEVIENRVKNIDTSRFDQEYRVLKSDGSVRWVRARTFPVTGKHGDSFCVAGIAHDITEEVEYRENQRAIQAKLRLASMVFDNSDEAILVTDLKGRIVEVNPAFERITGYARDEVLGKNPSLMKSGRHGRPFYINLWQELLTSGRWQGEVWDRRKSGEIYPKWLTITTVEGCDGKPQNYVGLFSDISRIKQSEEVLERMAHFDPLTDLPNRVLFRDRLGQAISEIETTRSMLALLFLDLDGFKQVNDSLGHTAGDLVLMETARRLSSVIRKSDTVSRLGGDEFTIILNGISEEADAIQVAEKILNVLREPFRIDMHTFHITVSIGIAFSPRHGETVEDLIRYSDASMYRAKEAGKNCYYILD